MTLRVADVYETTADFYQTTRCLLP